MLQNSNHPYGRNKIYGQQSTELPYYELHLSFTGFSKDGVPVIILFFVYYTNVSELAG